MGVTDLLNTMNANESQFSIEISGIPNSLFQVTEFKSEQDKLCEDFNFQIQLISQQLIDPKSIIGKDISLQLLWSTANRSISGLVTQVISRGNDHQGYHYTFVLSSYLSVLKLRHSNRVFTQTSVEAIITTVFQRSGYPMDKLQMQASGPTLEMVVQYDESDFIFVTRLMRRYGFVYGFIEEESGKCTLLVCNSSSEFSQHCPEVNLGYVPPSGQVRQTETIFALSKKAHLLTDQVSMDDYNYEQPSNLQVKTRNQTDIAGFGNDIRYGENYKQSAEGQHLADIRQLSIDSQREELIIDTDCRALRPGVILNIYDTEDNDGSYLVVKVAHQGDQNAGIEYGNHVKSLNYKSQVGLVPLEQDYKAPQIENRRVFNTFSAIIEQEVDEKGQYIVKLPFNQDGQGQQSKPTRLVQPFGGVNHGMHFPLTQGTEVLVCGENGDLDRPIILGTLTNNNAPSPVTSQNSSENKLVTRAGHTLLMDDKQGQEKIQLATNNNKNSLMLDATNSAHHATLQSVEGDVKITAKEKIQLSSEGEINATSGADIVIAATDNIQMQSREGNINLSASKNIEASSDADIRLQSTDGNLELQSSEAMNFQAAQDTTLLSSEGNITLQASNGDVTLNTASNMTLLAQGGGKIHLSQGSGSIEIDRAGNITIDGQNITLSATNIAIKGNAISNN